MEHNMKEKLNRAVSLLDLFRTFAGGGMAKYIQLNDLKSAAKYANRWKALSHGILTLLLRKELE